MDRLKKALKIKENALSIFSEAKKGLLDAIERFQDHKDSANYAIERHNRGIDEEQAVHDFADEQIRHANNTIQKIDTILS